MPRLLGRWPVALLLLITVDAKVRTPDYCQTASDCRSGLTCDTIGKVCVPLDGSTPFDSSTGGGAGGMGTGAAGGGGIGVGGAGTGGVGAGGAGVGGAGTGGGLPDAGIDTKTGCDGPADCASTPATPACDTSTRMCVGCVSSGDCGGSKPACDLTAHVCVPCVSNNDCGAPTVCDTTRHLCVGCNGNRDCAPPNGVCDTATRSCVGCLASTDCAAPTPACNTATRTCVECVTKSNCGGAKPACDTSTNACVGCLLRSDCGGTKPACDTSRKTCVACLASTDCGTPTPACNTVTQSCVECVGRSDCAGSRPACDTAASMCVGCLVRSDCGGSTPACDTTTKTCVHCLGNTDCSTPTAVCDTSAQSCVGCLQRSDCSAPTPACDTSAKTCVGCLGNTDCMAPTGVCDTSAKACVQCLGNTDCGGTTPVCASRACRACRADSECPSDPGVCMPDGHCATNTEVIYVKGGASCPGLGTLAAPYCQASAAMAAVTSAQRIVVIRGPGAVVEWSLSFASAPVTIVGQQGAFTTGTVSNASDLITNSGADVLIRDLSVVGTATSNVGITARNGSTLRLLRCLIASNPGGGVVVTTNSGFDIENTVIAHNGGSTASGIRLDTTTATPTIFQNNTVVENGQVGVSCGAAYSLIGSLIAGNGLAQVGASCLLPDACGTGCTFGPGTLMAGTNPMLDETMDRYQLTAASPTACKNMLSSAPSPDRKGTTRPQGPRSDCGADEYAP